MLKRKKRFEMIVEVFTAVLILAYAFIAFLPHSHECIDADCAICAFIESCQNTLLGISLSISLYKLDKIPLVLLHTYFGVSSARDGTPVGLKVKLSD